MARALSVIASLLKIIIPIPDNFPRVDVRRAEIVAEILQTGKTRQLTLLPKEMAEIDAPIVFGGNATNNFISDVLNEFQQKGYATIELPASWEVSIFGQEILLGEAQFSLYCVRMLDNIETDNFLNSTDAVIMEDLTPFATLVDVKRSHMRFPNWSTDDKVAS